jgi:radical SAM protein with 4Fe4S-binding SPASM domain
MKWMEQGIPVFSMWVRDANTAVNNYNNSRAWKSRCGLGTGSVGIDYDGTIYPCHRFIDSHEIKIGNIYTGFNQTQTDFVKNWCKVPPYCEKPKKCLNCNYKKACSGGCIAMNYDILGTVHAIPDTFCTIKQIITNTLGNLCKTLKNNKNKTFNNLYNNKQQQPPPQQRQPRQQQTQTQPTTTTTPTSQTTNDLCSCQDKPHYHHHTNNNTNKNIQQQKLGNTTDKTVQQ